MRIITKTGSSNLITYGLTYKEIECRCLYQDCNHTIITSSILDSYRRVRVGFNQPLTINSGFRCQRHNFDVGGSPTSRHLYLALDISHDEFEEDSKSELLSLLRRHFDFVKVYGTFFHCHNDIELG